MRILAVPAAMLLACCLYLPLPRVRCLYEACLRALYAQAMKLFTRKNGKTDDAPVLPVYLLLLGGVFSLLGAIHPLVSMLLMTPAFTGLAELPPCARVKEDLDSGKYARDIPAYEDLVRRTCASFGPAFAHGIVMPMILCCAFMPLHAGAGAGAVYAALCALSAQRSDAAKITARLHRFGERALIAFMVLCSGIVGRNPLRTKGKTADARLLSILGIAGDHTDTHAPMSGDIPQGVFLCGFSTFILCFTLCAAGLVLCR